MIGLAVVGRLANFTGRPDHWIVSLALVGIIVAVTASSVLSTTTLFVDVEARRIESATGSFTFERRAKLQIVDAPPHGTALRIEGADLRPLLVAAKIDAEHLREVARLLSNLLGGLDFTDATGARGSTSQP